jgi:hypothetical protein
MKEDVSQVKEDVSQGVFFAVHSTQESKNVRYRTSGLN